MERCRQVEMKTRKSAFILMEMVLAVIVIILAVVMIRGENGKARDKISVIIPNSDDNQWAAFRYGLKMAAEDQGVELFVVNTEGALSAEEEKEIIEREIGNGADAVIVQPVPGEGTEEMLKQIGKKVPVMLVEYAASADRKDSELSITGPDNYAMGVTLAEKLLEDYRGNIDGKTLRIISGTNGSEAVIKRVQGFRDTLEGMDVEINWSVSRSFFRGGGENFLKTRPKTDFVIALDDNSLIAAGKCSAENDLHGALVYGIGRSTEAVYYLDTGNAECLVIPDEFNMGYQSMTEVAEALRNYFYKIQSRTISYKAIRTEELFTEENQKIIFTMSQ